MFLETRFKYLAVFLVVSPGFNTYAGVTCNKFDFNAWDPYRPQAQGPIDRPLSHGNGHVSDATISDTREA